MCRHRRSAVRSALSAVGPARSRLLVLTVGPWLDIWLETRQTLRPATRQIYAQLIRDYVKPRLGGVPLRDRDLTVGRVQAMFTALLRANAKRARPLAPATFQRHGTVECLGGRSQCLTQCEPAGVQRGQERCSFSQDATSSVVSRWAIPSAVRESTTVRLTSYQVSRAVTTRRRVAGSSIVARSASIPASRSAVMRALASPSRFASWATSRHCVPSHQ